MQTEVEAVGPFWKGAVEEIQRPVLVVLNKRSAFGNVGINLFRTEGCSCHERYSRPRWGNVEAAAGSGTVRPDNRGGKGGKPIREAGMCIKNFGSDLPC